MMKGFPLHLWGIYRGRGGPGDMADNVSTSLVLGVSLVVATLTSGCILFFMHPHSGLLAWYWLPAVVYHNFLLPAAVIDLWIGVAILVFWQPFIVLPILGVVGLSIWWMG